MRGLLGSVRRLGFAAMVFATAIAGGAFATNYGPMMLQNLGSDIAPADRATFLANIGAQGGLGYTAINKAGDTMTGLLGLTQAASVSAAGSTQGTATVLTAQTTVVTTVAASTGVELSASATGVRQVVFNRGANILSVYPPSGAAIEGLGANVAAGVAVNGMVAVTCVSSTQCWAGS